MNSRSSQCGPEKLGLREPIRAYPSSQWAGAGADRNDALFEDWFGLEGWRAENPRRRRRVYILDGPDAGEYRGGLERRGATLVDSVLVPALREARKPVEDARLLVLDVSGREGVRLADLIERWHGLGFVVWCVWAGVETHWPWGIEESAFTHLEDAQEADLLIQIPRDNRRLRWPDSASLNAGDARAVVDWLFTAGWLRPGRPQVIDRSDGQLLEMTVDADATISAIPYDAEDALDQQETSRDV